MGMLGVAKTMGATLGAGGGVGIGVRIGVGVGGGVGIEGVGGTKTGSLETGSTPL